MHKSARAGVIIGLAAVNICVAQQSSNNEIVVTAGRVNRESCDVPANVSVITSDEIREAGCVNVVDALRNLDGVQARSIAGPANAEVSMRGFGENGHGRVLVLLDGRRLNRPDMAGINWLEIPLSDIDRIEVVRGGNSALYGDHAVGGVINVITRKGDRVPHFNISEDVGSFGMSATRIGAASSIDGLSFNANGERYESDGFRERTAFLSEGGGGNLTYDINQQITASLSLSGQAVEYEIPGWLSKQQMDENPDQALNQDDSADNKYFNADMGLDAAPAQGHRFEVNFAYGRQDMESDMVSWQSFADVVIDTIGVTPRYSIETDLAGHGNKALIGVDFYSDTLNVDRYSDKARSALTTTAEVRKDSIGAYLRDEFDVIDSLTLGAGARAESARISADVGSAEAETVDGSTTHRETAFDLSLIKTFENKSKVFTKGGTLYRYPFVDEQVSYIGFGTDQFYADLKPEEGWNVEAGAEVRLGGGLIASLAMFRLDMRDEIAWDFVANRNENLDESTRQGVEVAVDCAACGFMKLSANYTYTDARFTAGVNDGKDVPLVSKHKASGDIKLVLPLNLTLDTIVSYVGESYLGGDYGNTGPKLSDYTTVDMFVRHACKAIRGLEVFAGSENIFDEKYAGLGYKGMTDDAYYPAPGRSFRGGMSYRF